MMASLNKLKVVESLPADAEEIVTRLSNELMQARDELAEAKLLRRELHNERVWRYEWEKLNDRLIAGTEIEYLQGRLGQAKTAFNHEVDSRVRAELEVEQLRARLRQALEELVAVDESLGEFYCPVLDPETDEPCGSYWKDHGVNMMHQALNIALQAAQDQSNEVQEPWLSPCKAEGLKRQPAEAIVAQADAELAAHVHDKACGELAQTVHTERALRREAEQCAKDAEKDKRGALIIAQNRLIRLEQAEHRAKQAEARLQTVEQRAERAEALAALVTPKWANLLTWLAIDIEILREHFVDTFDNDDQRDVKVKTARALAAKIREAIGEH